MTGRDQPVGDYTLEDFRADVFDDLAAWLTSGPTPSGPDEDWRIEPRRTEPLPVRLPEPPASPGVSDRLGVLPVLAGIASSLGIMLLMMRIVAASLQWGASPQRLGLPGSRGVRCTLKPESTDRMTTDSRSRFGTGSGTGAQVLKDQS